MSQSSFMRYYGSYIGDVIPIDSGYFFTGSSTKISYENGFISGLDGPVSVLIDDTTAFRIGNAGNGNIVVTKVKLDGAIIWSKQLTDTEWAITRMIYMLEEGNAVIAYTNSTADRDFNLLKMDLDGNILWSKQYGGTSSEHVYEVTQLTDGTIVFAGTTNSYGVQSAFWTNGYIIGVNPSNGLATFADSYGDYDHSDDIKDVAPSGTGFVITGRAWIQSELGTNIVVAKFDSNGSKIWARSIGKSTDSEYGVKVVTTTDGSVIVAAHDSYYKIILIKLDSNGNTDWIKYFYDGDNGIQDLQPIDNNGFLFCGGSSTAFYGNFLMKSYGSDTTSCDSITTPANTDYSNTSLSYFASFGSTTTYTKSVTPFNEAMSDMNPTTGLSDTLYCTNAVFMTTADIEQDRVSIKIYPNPTNGIVTVEGTDLWKINVIDIAGQCVFQSHGSNLNSTILELTPGLYIIQAYSTNGTMQSTKLIVY